MKCIKLVLWILCFSPMFVLGAKLPDWAESALAEARHATPPKDVSVWRILDETQITLQRDGSFRKEQRIVQMILEDGAAEDGGYYAIDADTSIKIRRLKGWHALPGGKVESLDRENIATVGTATTGKVDTGTVTVAGFEQVGRGSAVAFQSRQTSKSFFSMETLGLTSSFPVRKVVIRLKNDTGNAGMRPVLKPLQFEAWGLPHRLENNGTTLIVEHIPAFEAEILRPGSYESYPRVEAGFAQASGGRLESWDSLAKWYWNLFNQSATGVTSQKTGVIKDLAALKVFTDYFDQKITYRQRYMTADRGWTPAKGSDVARRAYGDCKDMVACLAYRAANDGITVLPVLASIGNGERLTGQDSARPNFNHLIAAIPLGDSLQLPAEVEIDEGRYLIYDPTSKYTRPGYLPGYYKGRSVMICTPGGARWTAIPDAALESQAMEVVLGGLMDAQFTLNGTLQIIEEGDAYGFRTTERNSNPRDLEYQVRDFFELPGVVDLAPVMGAIDDRQRLKLIYTIKWPSFLRRDMGGLRLPFGIVGYSKGKLVKPGETRQLPIEFSESAPITWNLNIKSAVGLTPGEAAFSWKGDHHAIEWKATPGKTLEVVYVWHQTEAYYSKTNIQDGLAYWDTYRDAFNEFWLGGTLFDVQN